MKSRRRIFSQMAWFLIVAVLAGSHVVVPFAAPFVPMQEGQMRGVHSSSDDTGEIQSPSDASNDQDQPLLNDISPMMGMRPPVIEIDSWDMLKAWYQEAADSGKEAFGRLTGDVYVDETWCMDESTGYITLETGMYKIIVPGGVTFTVDNPQLYLVGDGPVLYVMMGAGGELVRGNLLGTGSGGIAALAYAPANLTVSETFTVGTILYLNEDIVASPSQGMEREILNVFESPAVAMTVGDIPQLPEKVQLQAMSSVSGSGSHETLWVSVQWQTEDVDFTVAGEKIITGVFSEEILTEKKLINSKKLTGIIRVLAHEPGPIQKFSGQVVNVVGSGMDRKAVLRFALPMLSKEVRAVYLEQSPDGASWNRVENFMGTPEDPDNFLEQIHVTETRGFLVYYAPVTGKTMWFRLEIQGSAQEGKSNPVMISVPNPGEKPNHGQDKPENDGSSGGNRGGIGQEESDRVIPAREVNGPKLHLVSPIPVYAAELETTEAVQLPEREEEKTEEVPVRKRVENEAIKPMLEEPEETKPAEMETTVASLPVEPTLTVEEPENPVYPWSTGATVAAICAAAGVHGFWLFRKKIK